MPGRAQSSGMTHVILVIAVAIFIGYTLWYLNRGIKPPELKTLPATTLIPPRPTYDPQWALGFREPERDFWQKPDQVLEAIGDISSLRVADIGCGEGYFTLRLLDRVGPLGQVFATDIQAEMLAELKGRVSDDLMPRLVLIQATPTGIGIDETMDLIFMIQVLGEVDRQAEFLKQVQLIMHPQSRLVVIDSKHVSDPDTGYSYPLNLSLLIGEFDKLGFRLMPEGRHAFLPRQFFLVFQLKPNDPQVSESPTLDR